MIAAIANLNGLTVVTRTVAHFASFGVGLLDPFEFGTNARNAD
jgi:predicted nucleic acid-binding protein